MTIFRAPKSRRRDIRRHFPARRLTTASPCLPASRPAMSICGNPRFPDEQKRLIAGTVGDVRIVCAYIPNGQAVGSDKYDYKLRWLDALTGWLADEIAAHPNLALCGDYNIAPDDRDVHDPNAWAGQILCSRTRTQRLPAPARSRPRGQFPPVRPSPRRPFRGGTTACWVSRRTSVCASTMCCCHQPWRGAARQPASTARRASASAPRTMPRSGQALPEIMPDAVNREDLVNFTPLWPGCRTSDWVRCSARRRWISRPGARSLPSISPARDSRCCSQAASRWSSSRRAAAN